MFDSLVGQEEPVATLRRGGRGGRRDVRRPARPVGTAGAMTHAWLFTGPPGSGRSVAARAFAAALQCATGTGCGECPGCHTTLAGTHADVRFVVPEGLSIGVGEMRALVLRAASAPTGGRWQVLLVEDADRLTEAAGNALLKAIEEPPPRTVFLLCTPSTHPDDISVTIRSRCRVVPLRQPPADAVADGAGAPRRRRRRTSAAWAAAAAQGHVGRARRLARDPQARARREAVLAVPRRLTGIGACFDAADRADRGRRGRGRRVGGRDSTPARRPTLETALGAGGTGRGAAGAVRGAAGPAQGPGAPAEVAGHPGPAGRARPGAGRPGRLLPRRAGARVRRAGRAGARRHAPSWPAPAAQKWTPESALRRLEAVLACRDAIEANVKPRIAVEAMMLALWRG